MPETPPPDQRELGYYLTLAQTGMELVVPLIVGLVIDYYAGSSPWGLVIGAILGFVGMMTHLVVLANRYDSLKRDKKKENGA